VKNILQKFLSIYFIATVLLLLGGVALAQQSFSGNDLFYLNTNSSGRLFIGTQGAQDIKLLASQGSSALGFEIDGSTGDLLPHSATSKILRSGSATAVAAAGTTQGTATALTADYNVVTSCTDASADSVVLPAARDGLLLVIRNEGACGGATDLQVFPATGDEINNGGANTLDELLDGATGIYVAVDGTDWFSIEAVASP